MDEISQNKNKHKISRRMKGNKQENEKVGRKLPYRSKENEEKKGRVQVLTRNGGDGGSCG